MLGLAFECIFCEIWFFCPYEIDFINEHLVNYFYRLIFKCNWCATWSYCSSNKANWKIFSVMVFIIQQLIMLAIGFVGKNVLNKRVLHHLAFWEAWHLLGYRFNFRDNHLIILCFHNFDNVGKYNLNWNLTLYISIIQCL